jgi:aryl-alcohol dehydrogenase-like predicted oxidoreductase
MILGCSSIGGLFSERDPQTAADGLAAARDVGIRTFDTPPHYRVGPGARWAEKVHQNAAYLHEAVPRELSDELAAEGLVAPVAGTAPGARHDARG